MVEKMTVIGGDLRILKLVEMLAQEHIKIFAYGLENADNLKQEENIYLCDSLQEAVQSSSMIIGPIPLSSNGQQINMPFSEENVSIEQLANVLDNHTFIAGSINPEFYELTQGKQVEVIDLFHREELTVLNTISTAEGAIQIAMEETPRTLHGSKVLVMGFGRVGKILAKMLEGIGAHVFCEARKASDLAWIKAYGYEPIHLNELKDQIADFDIIINTIPFVVLDAEKLERVKQDCLLIDLASNPGGIDQNAVKQRGLKMIWALSLPGKVAPITSAEFIKETLFNILKELKK